jgi:hypothetical protein
MSTLPPDTYWIIQGKFLAGPDPLRMPGRLPKESIDELIGIGIDAFIDLTDSYELMGASYLPLIEKLPGSDRIKYFNYPINDRGIPTLHTMREILDLIHWLIEQQSILYLHCYSGIGRTGTVVGCYLVEEGFKGHQALQEIRFLREDLDRKWIASPETDAQIKYVLGWRRLGSKNEILT